jgi:hypothetical protein
MSNPLIGKLISLTEDYFVVFADKNMENIDTIKIIRILDPASFLYSEYKVSKEAGRNKTYYYFGAGYAITKPGANIDRSFKNGFNINAGSLFTFSKYFGIRTDFDFYHFEREDYYYSYNYSGYSNSGSYTGGAVNCFLFKANLAFGALNPDEPIQVYFLPSLGTGLSFEKSRKYTSVYNNNPPVISTGGNNSGYFSIGVSMGLGFNVKLANKIRGFAEYQFNAWYLGENGPPEFSAIKLGVIL